jgi:hypothetical protein
MSTRWEYKVAFVDGWERTSTEGHESRPEERERNSGFARRFLNGMGADGWELVGIQHVGHERAYYVFKRPLADGAEPDMSVARREPAQTPAPNQQQTTPTSAEVVSV